MTKSPPTPEYRMVDVADLVPYAENARTHTDEQVAEIAASILEFGFINPVIISGTEPLLAGHGRLLAAYRLGLVSVPAVDASWLTPIQIEAYRIADNKIAENSTWDTGLLRVALGRLKTASFDLSLTGFSLGETQTLFKLGGSGAPSANGSLAARFGIPPFSVLNAREGWWQERKRAWIDFGVRGDEGRGEEGALTFVRGRTLADDLDEVSRKILTIGGMSIFDPVLAELAYRWWGIDGGTVLDPFAGESTKGIVCEAIGMKYTGVELRPEQCDANRAIALKLNIPMPRWVCCDSTKIDTVLEPDEQFDFVFTSPPYYDLETYSGRKEDGSAMPTYAEFMAFYADVFTKTVAHLRDNRFLVVKVGEVRGKNGAFHNFVGDNITLFKSLGLHYYNEAILVTAVGSVPLMAGRPFQVARKLAKTHQNILVFYKGDLRKIKSVFDHDIEFGDVES